MPTKKKRTRKKQKFHDPTQQAEGKAARWKNEPIEERHESLIVHTNRPFNAEPTNEALQEMYTPKGQHYRRTHAPVPLVDKNKYVLKILIGDEKEKENEYNLGYNEMINKFNNENKYKEVSVTMMCTGNRRGEYNEYGSTAGLPWANGSISTAKWGGYLLKDILNSFDLYYNDLIKRGYKYITFWGMEGYHISIPLSKGMDINGDVILAIKMNGDDLPRDHGAPLRCVVPGFVGARAVKWIEKIVIMKNEVNGPHQTGIAYKQLGPNYRELGKISKEIIAELPPIDIIPVTSAITAPEYDDVINVNNNKLNDTVSIKGYAYSGGGRAIARVDISLDNGKTWDQAKIIRVPNQNIRSYKAWAWSQWRYEAPMSKIKDIMSSQSNNELNIICKAVDDQYNQQPHAVAPIWNVRGILNTSWPRVDVTAKMINQARL